MSAASVGLNLLQDMNEPVFEMKFESLSPTSKVAYRLDDKEALYMRNVLRLTLNVKTSLRFMLFEPLKSREKVWL